MQTEILNTVSEKEKQSYLRVATVAGKSTLTFFYIGATRQCTDGLEAAFSKGISAESFEEAKHYILSNKMVCQTVDVVFIDLPYQQEKVKDFSLFCKSINAFPQHTPVIYNVSQLEGSTIPDGSCVDDVIDLKGWQYDFTSKIAFLKKVKEFGTKPSEDSTERIRPNTCIYKRAFDILASSLLLIMLLPVMLLIALIIRLESKGPIFYVAKRAGRGFRIFRFYKFRTMVVNADKRIQELAHLNQYTGSANGAKFFKISNDPRITKVGKFLRNSSLDELPQLFNVLKGDMSLVGNRPLPLYEAATLTTNEFVERFMAPAGITGLWQIKKRGRAEMSIEERIGLDIDYARKFNLLYDFWIMAKTPTALLQKSNV